MRKLFLFTFVILILSVCVKAQTTPDEIRQRLKDIDVEVSKLENEIKAAKSDLSKLLVKYTNEYSEVKKLQNDVKALENRLIELNFEKKNLMQKEFIRMLPNNEIQLLKMIVIQNQKIIELLENIARR